MPVPSDVDYFFASSTMLKIAAPVLLLLVGSAIGFDHVGEEFSDLSDRQGIFDSIDTFLDKSESFRRFPSHLTANRQRYQDGHYTEESLSYRSPVQVLLNRRFDRKSDKFNPNAPDSQFFWLPGPGGPYDRANQRRFYDHTRFTALPHQTPGTLPHPDVTAEGDMFALTRQEYSFDDDKAATGSTEHIQLRGRISCRIHGVREHPFPKSLVARPDDDLRLANCAHGITTLKFAAAISITNEGLWALYSINRDNETDGFAQLVRLASRRSTDSVHDIAVDITSDGRVTYIVDGAERWSVASLGLLSDDPRAVTVMKVGNTGRYARASVPSVRLGFTIISDMHYSDPNNRHVSKGLIRLGLDYSNAMRFHDEKAQRSNRLFGHGTEMDVYSVSVVKYETKEH